MMEVSSAKLAPPAGQRAQHGWAPPQACWTPFPFASRERLSRLPAVPSVLCPFVASPALTARLLQ